MAKEKIQRPESAAVKDMIARATRIDERMLELLKTKQQQFDSFADESVVGEESLRPSEQSWISKLVEEEQQRFAKES